MKDVVGQLPLHVPVESGNDEVAIVFVFHQFLDSGEFEPTNALALQDTVDHLLQEELIFTGKGRK